MSRTPQPRPLHPLQSDEFLPPMSRWMTLGGLFLVGTFGAAIALASVTKYHSTIRAAAIVRPAGEVRIVQAGTEGTVESVAVNENQIVKQGDAIAKIDSSHLRSQKNQLQDNIQQCELELSQINQQVNNLENQIFATAQSKSSPNKTPAIASESVESALVQLAGSMPDLSQQLARDRRSLVVKRSDIQKQIIQGKKELDRIAFKLENSVVKAPTDGTILKMELRNPGQTVQLGAAIAQIVPSDVPLVLKARVAAQDIGQVKLSQPVQIRISAFPYPDYGTLKGTVSAISPDAIAPQNYSSGEAYYEVTIQPEKAYLVRDKSRNSVFLGTQKAYTARQ
ncbi:MAG TPA: HlyD family efflux transporter periplasmic adaptor subunit [Kamptonema sp.]|nr:HlyD family efflux transporter periplasmic adaptor subunit [Kamptonema sp.]